MGEQDIGKIDKRIIKLTREDEEKNNVAGTAAAKLERAKVAKDEVTRQ